MSAEQLNELAAQVRGSDLRQHLTAVSQLRKLLSLETNPPINEVIATGVVPPLVQFLANHSTPMLQFEAAWCLTNIASGTSDQARAVVEAGAVPLLVQLLAAATNDDVREQAVWALGSLAGDSPPLRDYVLQQGVLPPLLAAVTEASKLSLLRNVTWSLSNLCRGKPQPNFELVRPALPTLARLIYANDDEVLSDACWALSYLADGPDDRIQAVIEAGVCRRLVELLMHVQDSVKVPALRAVANVVTGDDTQTQVMLNVGVLSHLHFLLHHRKRSVRKEVCWAISNITAGPTPHVQAVIDANIIPQLIHLLRGDGEGSRQATSGFQLTSELEVQTEAACALGNAIGSGKPVQVQYILAQGCVQALCQFLSLAGNRHSAVLVALEALDNVLQADSTSGSKQLIEDVGGQALIEQLQASSSNDDVQAKAAHILSTYYGLQVAERDDMEDDLGPTTEASTPPFTFGAFRSALP